MPGFTPHEAPGTPLLADPIAAARRRQFYQDTPKKAVPELKRLQKTQMELRLRRSRLEHSLLQQVNVIDGASQIAMGVAEYPTMTDSGSELHEGSGSGTPSSSAPHTPPLRPSLVPFNPEIVSSPRRSSSELISSPFPEPSRSQTGNFGPGICPSSEPPGKKHDKRRQHEGQFGRK